MKIKLIGGSGRRGRTPSVPLAFKVRVLELCEGGVKAVDAYRTAAEEFSVDATENQLKYAGSHKWRFTKEVGKLVLAGDEEAVALAENAGLQFEEASA